MTQSNANIILNHCRLPNKEIPKNASIKYGIYEVCHLKAEQLHKKKSSHFIYFVFIAIIFNRDFLKICSHLFSEMLDSMSVRDCLCEDDLTFFFFLLLMRAFG